VRKPTSAGRRAREAALIAEGRPPFKGALWFRPGHGWGVKRRRTNAIGGKFTAGAAVRGGEVAAYLAVTGKAAVPAHDPAFGRLAA
jgi:hypothetical protein